MKDQAKYFLELYSSFVGGELQTKTFKRNEFICQLGQVEKNLYLVQEGAIRAFYFDGEDEQSVRFGYQNSVINSMQSFFNQEPSELQLQALRETKVLVLPYQDYMAFIESSEYAIKAHIAVMNLLVLSMLERETDLMIKSPQVRYDRVLKRSPQLFQEIPLKYIASYLRMTPETLSRIRKE